MLGQLDLSAWVEAALGVELWSVQRRIGAAASKRRARVAVPSCNASGKTYLSARLALAFYDAFTPGTPCQQCGPGGCRGAKVLTTASQHEHLRDNLWGEMRLAEAELRARGIQLSGKMSLGQNLRLESAPGHFVVGRSPNSAEGFQGFHAAHKLILGDEATSLDMQMQQGITGLLATGDSRLLLIFNPTTDDTYAAMEARSPLTEVIKITAWDTPAFTGEHMPAGANLTTPEWLEELKAKGMGPGTYEWTTRVEADFWTQGENVLITPASFDKATGAHVLSGTKALGIDLAPYGDDENVIARRDGNALTRLNAYPAMRPDLFIKGPVMDAVLEHAPDYLIWDADGVGAGTYGDMEYVQQVFNSRHGGNMVLLPFRGGTHVTTKFANTRSAWWWALRRRFEMDNIALTLPRDDKLRAQITDIRYSITDAGDIKIETKKEMKKRGRESPDRGDAAMYAFSMVEELPIPSRVVEEPVTEYFGLKDRSIDAMWRRDLHKQRYGDRQRKTPWDSPSAGQLAWDDI